MGGRSSSNCSPPMPESVGWSWRRPPLCAIAADWCASGWVASPAPAKLLHLHRPSLAWGRWRTFSRGGRRASSNNGGLLFPASASSTSTAPGGCGCTTNWDPSSRRLGRWGRLSCPLRPGSRCPVRCSPQGKWHLLRRENPKDSCQHVPLARADCCPQPLRQPCCSCSAGRRLGQGRHLRSDYDVPIAEKPAARSIRLTRQHGR